MRRLLSLVVVALALVGCGGVHPTLPVRLDLPPATGPVLASAVGHGSRAISFTTPKRGGVQVWLVCEGARKTKVVVGRYMRFAIICNGPTSGGESSSAMPHRKRFVARITTTPGTIWAVRVEQVKKHTGR